MCTKHVLWSNMNKKTEFMKYYGNITNHLNITKLYLKIWIFESFFLDFYFYICGIAFSKINFFFMQAKDE